MTNRMRAAQAAGDHWGLAVKNCVDALGRLPESTNLGLLYVTADFADDLSSIVTFLRKTTPVGHWLGAAGFSIFGPLGEIHQRPGIAMMVGSLAEGMLRLFDGFEADGRDRFLAEHGAWIDSQSRITGLVHADPQDQPAAAMVAALAEATGAFLMGGLTAGAHVATAQSAGREQGKGLSGALFGSGVTLAVGLTQGCVPIGLPHRITQVVDTIIMSLDHRPALDVLKEEAGEIIARDLRRAAGLIHVARPVPGSDNPDYVVRGLLAIDPGRGWMAVGDRLTEGDLLMFVRRDPNTAQLDMRRMLAGLAKRLDGQSIRGGVYVSCVSRGPHMFGHPGREIEMIHEALGDFPLVGFAANGEFCHDRHYTYTGVLAVFL